jgi:exodeoxyribonuclease VII large subunit
VGRGGGSIEDLWAFNEEPLARAIAESPVPVISAVGHEVDVTISDLVADLRAATPSAAAEAAVQDRRALREVLEGVRPRMARALRHQTDRRRHRIDAAKLRVTRGVHRLVEPRRRALARAGERLATGMRRTLHLRRERLGTLSAKVDSLSPLSTLRRGYAVAIGADGEVLRRAGDFRNAPRFELRVVDGRVRCETLEVEEEVVE